MVEIFVHDILCEVQIYSQQYRLCQTVYATVFHSWNICSFRYFCILKKMLKHHINYPSEGLEMIIKKYTIFFTIWELNMEQQIL